MNDVLGLLAGSECPWCGGLLERGEYKGDSAAVCGSCQTPTARVWEATTDG